MPKSVGTWMLLFMASLLCFAIIIPEAVAQNRVKLPPKQSSPTSLVPAKEPHPARLRSALLSIHGFSRPALDAASADVPTLLRQFISDSNESVTIHRQAIKALRLYPSSKNLAFIQARVNLAPVGLKRLYAAALGRYTGTLQTGAAVLLRGLVGDPDAGVRHSAIDAVRLLGVDADSRNIFTERLQVEPDPAVKRALSTALQD